MSVKVGEMNDMDVLKAVIYMLYGIKGCIFMFFYSLNCLCLKNVITFAASIENF